MCLKLLCQWTVNSSLVLPTIIKFEVGRNSSIRQEEFFQTLLQRSWKWSFARILRATFSQCLSIIIARDRSAVKYWEFIMMAEMTEKDDLLLRALLATPMWSDIHSGVFDEVLVQIFYFFFVVLMTEYIFLLKIRFIFPM